MKTLEQIQIERQKKIDVLLSKNINPYPCQHYKRIPIHEARGKMDEKVTVTGRIFSVRGHGKLVFIDLKDETGKLQLMLKEDLLASSLFEIANLVDVGDFIIATGTITKTQRGEVTVLVEDIKILSKSVRPLPEKHHGLKDVEERYRQRYVDLLVNPETKKVFLTRSRIIKLLRTYLDNHGFVEVETPVLQQIYGGATAKPFITHHNALDTDLFLRISKELFLKRLMVGGFEKVYEVGKDFRNEGLSRAHNPEFTMMEFYWAYVDYEFLMDFTEKMLNHVVMETHESLQVQYKDKVYDFTSPWKRISYKDVIKQYVNIDIDEVKDEQLLIDIVTKRNLLPRQKLVGYGPILDQLYKKYARPHLDGPLFLIDHPVAMRPLAKRKENDPAYAASFQLLIASEEFINAYNELNDPRDQRKRWEEEIDLAKKGAEEYQVLDEDYIRALEYGMPPTAGWGLGIDRLVAFLTNQHTIKDVILFPTLRPFALPVSSQTKHNVPTNASDATNEDYVAMRSKTIAIVQKHLKNKNLVKHCFAVEAAMRVLANHFGEDENLWGITGILHDADWEETQNDYKKHATKTVEWMKQDGITNRSIIQAILSHNYIYTGTQQPSTRMEWALYTCDDLTGLIIANTLVMPDKKLASVTPESVLKKFNTKSFAAGANRDQIKMCEEKLKIPLQEFIAIVLASLQEVSSSLGL